jgi:hypothetical protein
MATEITITLPDDVYQRAERFAQLANRDLNSVIADTVGASLSSINPHLESLPSTAQRYFLGIMEIDHKLT